MKVHFYKIFSLFIIVIFFPLYSSQSIIPQYNKKEVLNNKKRHSASSSPRLNISSRPTSQLKINRLIEAKKQILKGNYKTAKYLIGLVGDKSDYYPIKLYYLAILNFISKNYKASSVILEHSILNTNEYYSKICLLKIFSYLAIGNQNIQKEISRCQKQTISFSNNQQLWLKYLIDINNQRINLFDKKNSSIYLKNFLTDIEFTKIAMKLALYNGQYHIIEEQIKKFNPEYFLDEELKELIAFTYYRLGDNKMVFKFLENIDTPNAENIKGNIFLKSRKYEIALGHFQLALKYNPASKNALYRILPLAWILKKYDLAISILEKLKINKQEIIPYAYYLSLLSKKKNIKKIISTLNYKYKNYRPNEMPVIITHIITYLNILIKNEKEVQFYAKELCKKGLIIQCQQFKHLAFDKNFLLNISKNKYKLKKEKISTSNQTIYVDQNDVLELDLKNKNRVNYGKLY